MGKNELRKALKWIAIGAAAIAGIAALVVAYIAATFNPNDYKTQIVQAVQQKTGRTLELRGDIGLSIYPSIGARIADAWLSEPGGKKPFASVSSAVLSVKVMPLLSKEVIVDAVDVKGLKLNVERDRSGRMNFEDLTGPDKKRDEPSATPVKIDVAKIEISDAEVSYSDAAAGSRYRLWKLNLKTARIAPGVTTPIDLSANIAADKEKAALETRLKTRLTFDLERRVYKLDDLDLSAKGSYADVSNLQASARGDVEARLASSEYVAKSLTLALSGKRGGGDLSVKIEAPSLTLTRDKVEGGKLTLDAQLGDGKSKTNAKVSVARVQGAFNAFTAAPLEANVEMEGDGRTTTVRMNGTLNGNLEARRFELPRLSLVANVKDPKIPKGTLDASISGAARADLAQSTAGLDFTGQLDQSSVNGKVGIRRFSPLALTFDLDADQLDADALMGKSRQAKGAETKSAKPAAAAKDDRIDLSALKGIDASGSLRVGKLTLLNLKAAQARADVKVAGGRLDVSPISAQLYQGTLNGALSAQAADNPTFTVRQKLAGVTVGPLLRDAADIDTLEGKGSVAVDLTTHGATMASLKKALNGTASVNLVDGAVKGIDIAGKIRGARTTLQQLRGQQVQSSNKAEKTDFSELSASFNVKNGVARNDDLSMKSPLLRVGGAGNIDIGNDRLDYVLKATVVATSKGQGGRDAAELAGITVPVRLTGALDQPQWSIDFAGMAAALARQQLQDTLTRGVAGQPAKGGSPADALRGLAREGLKGILGR